MSIVFRSLGVMVALAAAISGAARAQDWKPERNVDIIVSSGAGGAADRQSREVQKFLQKIPGMPSVTVTNKPGGGGTLAQQYLIQQAGNAHYIGVLSTGLLTNNIVGLSKISYRDFTPLTILMHDYVVVWVRSESSIQSGRDLLERLKKDPKSVSFGFSTAPGNQNHIVIGMLARAANIDPKQVKTVIFSSGGQGTTAALGGHVDVWVGTAGGVVQHVESGAVRVLGLTAATRQPGALAVAPTFREQGIDASYNAWRGFIGPPGLTPAQIAFWDRTFAQVVNDPGWKSVQEKFLWGSDFKNSAETIKFLDSEEALLREMLTALGVIKR